MEGIGVMKIGIVPAAGVGSRWGGFPKFLLPVGDREWLLDRTINAMPVDKVIVVYGEETDSAIVHHIDRCGLNDKVILRPNEHMELDFYGSILAGIEDYADYYYFGMPDTYWPLNVFPKMGGRGITLGVHYTEKSDRFGMIRDGVVVNKQLGAPGMAWGLLGWNKEVRDLWLSTHLENYTDAINLAMQECNTQIIPMDYYYDMARFEDYANFIKRVA